MCCWWVWSWALGCPRSSRSASGPTRPVAAVNCLELDEEDIAAILGKVLVRFPLKEAALEIPA